MKQQFFATVSSFALLAGTASAADLPVKAMTAPPPTIAPSWTGPYIGLNGGAAWHRMTADIYEGSGRTYHTTLRDVGATIGVQAGYNWQVNNFVYGLEADLNWANARGSKTTESLVNPGEFTDFSTKLSWLSTIRARFGFTTSPTLYYLTGGVAFAGIKNRALVDGASGPIEENRTRTGWTVGAGIEHMFGHNWTAKVEVLYVDLGDKTVSERGGSTYTGRFKNTAVIGRVGINLKW